MLTSVEKNQKNVLNFGNSGEIWVSVFHVRSFEKVESVFERNMAASTIDICFIWDDPEYAQVTGLVEAKFQSQNCKKCEQ